MGDGSKIHFVLVVVDLMKMIKEISYRVFIITVPTAALAWIRRKKQEPRGKMAF